jgi:hypothetical protein
VILLGLVLLARREQSKAPNKGEPVAEDEPALPTATNKAPRLALPPVHLDAATAPQPKVATDDQLMRDIRENVRSNPERAGQLAREARLRFPESPNSDERDALLVDALINQQRIGAARSETYYYFDHHPGGKYAEHLFVMTGVHPTPSGPGGR